MKPSSAETQTRIVGNPFRGLRAQQRMFELRIGEPVLLRREPDNPVDKNAVKVHSLDGVFLGYIPAVLARIVAPALDKGMAMTARKSGRAGTGEITVRAARGGVVPPKKPKPLGYVFPEIDLDGAA